MKRILDNIVSDLVRIAVIGAVLWAFWHFYGREHWPEWRAALSSQSAAETITKPPRSDRKMEEAVNCQASAECAKQ